MKIAKKTLLIIIIVSIVLFMFVSYNREEDNRYNSTVYINGSYVVNPRNMRAIVGWSSHVFVAKVKRLEGSIDEPPERAQTFFSVEVLDTIKGELSQKITVAQYAFIKNNVLFIERCEQFLQPDQTYLFVTRYDETTNGYRIFSGGYGNIQIANEEQKAQLIAEFREAYDHELPLDLNNPEHIGSDQSTPIYPEPYPFEIACPDAASGSKAPATPLLPEPTTPPIQFTSPLPTPDLDPYPSS